MTVRGLFKHPVETTTPTRKRMAATMLLVWLAWFFVNLGANGLFYVSLHGGPGARLPVPLGRGKAIADERRRMQAQGRNPGLPMGPAVTA